MRSTNFFKISLTLGVASMMWSSVLGAATATTSVSSANQKGPTLSITGALMFNSYFGNQKNKNTLYYEKEKDNTANLTDGIKVESHQDGNASQAFALDNAKMAFQIKDKIDFATFHEWFLSMMLSGDRSAKTYRIVPQVYLALFSKFATVHLGNYIGVEDLMAYGGGMLMGASGGFTSSGHRNFVNITTGAYPKIELSGDSDDATKMTLISPRLWGFQAGVSYSPDTGRLGRRNRNDVSPLSTSDIMYNKNFWAFGLNFMEFLATDIRVALSATAVNGTPYALSKDGRVGHEKELVKFYRTQGVAVGGVVYWGDFAIGSEYGWQGQTGQFKGTNSVTPAHPNGAKPTLTYVGSNAQGPRFVDVAISYFFDPDVKGALGYYYSWRKTGFSDANGAHKATASIWNASLTYQACPGLEVYIEGFLHNTKNPSAVYEAQNRLMYVENLKKFDAVENQKAQTILVGTKVSF